MSESKKWNNENWLREQYITNELTLRELECRVEVSDTTLLRRMEDFGIERRESTSGLDNCLELPTPTTNNNGHRTIDHKHQGDRWHVGIHRLHATLLVDDIEEIADKEVHHQNGCPFDNRLENYDLLSPEEHYSITRSISELPPFKGLCRNCDETGYFFDAGNVRYCPFCGGKYDDGEIIETNTIDWSEFP